MASQRIPLIVAVEGEGARPAAVPVDVRRLIAAMARANITWGEERIAAEMQLKLAIQVSPRTVRRYLPSTEHPTAAWTIEQFRAIVPGDKPQRFLIHDRDSIYGAAVDDAVTAMGLTVLKTPVHSRRRTRSASD